MYFLLWIKIFWIRPVIQRHYIVMSSLIGWVHTQNDPCVSDRKLFLYLVEKSVFAPKPDEEIFQIEGLLIPFQHVHCRFWLF